jgi:hypothetical protein
MPDPNEGGCPKRCLQPLLKRTVRIMSDPWMTSARATSMMPQSISSIRVTQAGSPMMRLFVCAITPGSHSCAWGGLPLSR